MSVFCVEWRIAEGDLIREETSNKKAVLELIKLHRYEFVRLLRDGLVISLSAFLLMFDDYIVW